MSLTESRHLATLSTIPALMDARQAQTALFGPDDPKTLAVANSLAIAFWCAGDIDQAVDLLNQALNASAPSLATEDPVRVDLLCTPGEIMVEQVQMERARAIYCEVLDLWVRRSRANHPSSLAAKGDLALVLFELGDQEQALQLENQAYECARVYLGSRHSVSSVLAWNRLLRLEKNGEAGSATRMNSLGS